MIRHVALFALDAVSGTGPPQSAVLLANELAARGWRADLLLHRRRGDLLGQLRDDVRGDQRGGRPSLAAAREIVRRGAADLFFRSTTWHHAAQWPFWSLRALAAYLASERPEALCAFGTKPGITAAVLRASGSRIPVTATLSNDVSNWLARRQPRKRAMVARLEAADALLGCSESVTRDARLCLPGAAERCRTLHEPAVTPASFELARLPPSHPWLRERRERGGDAPSVIVSAGRLVPVKDHETLLRAFAQLRLPRAARLVIFGEGPLRQHLEALAKTLAVADRVDLPGYRVPLAPELAAAQLYVLSSRSEGLGKALVEAFASGLPAVATDVGGPHEILEGGRWGELVPPGDPDALARAIERALAAGPRPEALERRARWFSAERYAERYAELIEELTGGAARHPPEPTAAEGAA